MVRQVSQFDIMEGEGKKEWWPYPPGNCTPTPRDLTHTHSSIEWELLTPAKTPQKNSGRKDSNSTNPTTQLKWAIYVPLLTHFGFGSLLACCCSCCWSWWGEWCVGVSGGIKIDYCGPVRRTMSNLKARWHLKLQPREPERKRAEALFPPPTPHRCCCCISLATIPNPEIFLPEMDTFRQKSLSL